MIKQWRSVTTVTRASNHPRTLVAFSFNLSITDTTSRVKGRMKIGRSNSCTTIIVCVTRPKGLQSQTSFFLSYIHRTIHSRFIKIQQLIYCKWKYCSVFTVHIRLLIRGEIPRRQFASAHKAKRSSSCFRDWLDLAFAVNAVVGGAGALSFRNLSNSESTVNIRNRCLSVSVCVCVCV